jgi:signal transduction histidine kinase
MVVAGSLAALLAFALPLAVTAKLLVESRLYADAELRSGVVAAVLDEVGDLVAARDALDRIGEVDEVDELPITIAFDDGRVAGIPIDQRSRERALAAVTADDGDSARVRVDDDVLVVTRFGATASGPGAGVVIATVPDQLVTRDLDVWWWTIGGVAVALFVVFVVLADRLGRSIVGPVAAMVATSEDLRRGRLDARVVPGGPPELRRLGYVFNLLAERIGDLVRLERERVSDLSHRLRTPVTALHLDAEALGDEAERAHLLGRVERLEREITEVLAEARRATDPDEERTDLVAVCAERAAFWAPLLEDQHRRFTLGGGRATPARVALTPREATALVDELLGNAVAHTPPGAPVHLEVQTGPEHVAAIEVQDGGPGFPEGFAIGRGRSGGGSSGLGLDIVRRTAEGAGGDVTVARGPLGGAVVRVTLPIDGEGRHHPS